MRLPRQEKELRDAARHLYYEIKMLMDAIKELSSASLDDFTTKAFVEVFVDRAGKFCVT